jgi:hypothetical protein
MGANAEFKSFRATADIAPNTIVKFTANPGEVAPATAATDKIAGVTDSVAVKAGQMVDVAIEGCLPVKAGGVIAAGDPLTADASSKAVAAAFAEGVMKFVVGRALAPAVADDLVLFQVAPSVIAG